jgi:hypothetical protein
LSDVRYQWSERGVTKLTDVTCTYAVSSPSKNINKKLTKLTKGMYGLANT